MKRVAVSLLLVLPIFAFANSNCDKPINDFDGLYCLNKVYSAADSELNDRYKDLASLLDSSGKAKLKQGQLEWMKERNGQCSRHEDGQFFVNLSCATRQTIDRAQFLQSRIRECKSSGCLNSKL